MGKKKLIKKFVLYHSSNEVYYDMYLRGNILRTESAEMELYEAVLILIKLYGWPEWLFHVRRVRWALNFAWASYFSYVSNSGITVTRSLRWHYSRITFTIIGIVCQLLAEKRTVFCFPILYIQNMFIFISYKQVKS